MVCKCGFSSYARVALSNHPFHQHDVCELYGGTGHVVRMGLRRFGFSGRNFDLIVNIDLSKPSERKQFILYMKTFKPKV